MTRPGDEARSALVEHAERLFAERGIEAVSLRDVTAAAGQRNKSAAQYHFGDRRGLVAAVYEGRMTAVNERRHRHLAELDRRGCPNDLPGLVEAIVVPLVEVIAETNGWYGRFLARTISDPFARDVVKDLPTLSSAREATRRLREVLDELPRSIRGSRIEQLNTLVVGTVSAWEGAPERGERRLPARTLTRELIATGVAVLTAPVDAPFDALNTSY